MPHPLESLLPEHEPQRTVVRRWAIYGWSVADAIHDQQSQSRARDAIVQWINSPIVMRLLGYSIDDYIYPSRVHWWFRARSAGPKPPAKKERHEAAMRRVSVKSPEAKRLVIEAALRGGARQTDIAAVMQVSRGYVSGLWRAMERKRQSPWIKATPESLYLEDIAA